MLEILSLEKLAVKTSSDITRTISRENPNFDGTQSDFEAFGMKPQDYGDGMTDPSEASTFLGGKVLALAPGEKLESFESNRPNKTFDGFIEHLERDSLAGMLPYEFVANPTKAGGAVMRFVVAKADRKFSHRQAIMVQRFLTPVWGYIIGSAIKDGYLRSTEYWTNVSWTTPKRVTVDAGRDAQQNRQDIESGLKTLTENYLEEGQDPKEQMRSNAAEKRYLLDLSKEFDVPLSMLYKPQNVAPADINSAVAEEETAKMDDGAKIVEDDVDPDDEETFNK
jgi:capsid protein